MLISANATTVYFFILGENVTGTETGVSEWKQNTANS